MKKLDIIGKRFGKFTVIKYSKSDNSQKAMWECLCYCGNTKVVRGSDLKIGKILSCGCYNIEINKKVHKTHGESYTRFYRTWRSIQTRCNNPKIKQYKDWGGRGIRCEWKDYKEFSRDMYIKYIEHVQEFGEKQTTVDRIDPDGNYCKDNCRWATYYEQNNNTRKIKNENK